MSETFQGKTSDRDSRWESALLSLISLVLGCSALWFAWFRYDSIVNQSGTHWYAWVQTAAIAAVGVLCLLATVTFLFNKSSAKAMLKTGLSIVPILLFTNLVIFIVRIFQNILQGNATFVVDRLFAPPYKILIIPLIVIILVFLGSLSELDKKQD